MTIIPTVSFQFWWDHLGVPYDDVFFHDVYRKWKPIGLSNSAADGTKIAIQMAAQEMHYLNGMRKRPA